MMRTFVPGLLCLLTLSLAPANGASQDPPGPGEDCGNCEDITTEDGLQTLKCGDCKLSLFTEVNGWFTTCEQIAGDDSPCNTRLCFPFLLIRAKAEGNCQGQEFESVKPLSTAGAQIILGPAWSTLQTVSPGFSCGTDMQYEYTLSFTAPAHCAGQSITTEGLLGCNNCNQPQ